MVRLCFVDLSWAKLCKPQLELQHVPDITGKGSRGVCHQPGPRVYRRTPEAGLVICGIGACKSLQLMQDR